MSYVGYCTKTTFPSTSITSKNDLIMSILSLLILPIIYYHSKKQIKNQPRPSTSIKFIHMRDTGYWKWPGIIFKMIIFSNISSYNFPVCFFIYIYFFWSIIILLNIYQYFIYFFSNLFSIIFIFTLCSFQILL